MAVISYPSIFHLVDDGTWLIMDGASSRWFHTQSLIPFIEGFKDEHDVPTNELADLMKRSVAQCHIGWEFKDKKAKGIPIWSEGFYVTGGEGQNTKAKFWGYAGGHDLKDACDNLAKINPEFSQYYDAEHLSWWGCRLFNNEREARENFG